MTDYVITEYGARPEVDSTEAIELAVRACELTGGRVVVPAGVFVSGAIRLRSNVELHVSAGATLRFLTDPAAYPMVRTRWQGIECWSYSPLIYAYDELNVAVTGSGTLDGGAGPDNWWRDTKPVDDWNRLLQMVDDDVPVDERMFAPGHGFRPSFVQPHSCRRVRIEDVRIVNAPMWVVHPVFCSDVLVRGITVDSRGPNNDGCNPDSCHDVVISGCSFDTGDDCIAIKSGRDADGRRVARPSANILIESCRFGTGHGALTIGSETSGGIHNVQARDLHITGPAVDHALRIKSNSDRGGLIQHITLQDSVVDSVTTSAIHINTTHGTTTTTHHTGATAAHPNPGTTTESHPNPGTATEIHPGHGAATEIHSNPGIATEIHPGHGAATAVHPARGAATHADPGTATDIHASPDAATAGHGAATEIHPDHGAAAHAHHPTVRDISIVNLDVRHAPRTLEIHDTPQAPVLDLRLTR